jgi:hypothetical protein
VSGIEKVRCDANWLVEKVEKKIRDRYRLVGGSITANGELCDPDLPLRTYQGKKLSFNGFKSAAIEGKSTNCLRITCLA